MNNITSKHKTDLLMWAGILVISFIFIGIFMAFTTTSPIELIKKILSAILIMFLPGYVIVKLYLDDVHLTENPALDRFILSFGLSMVTVQSLAFLVNYFAIHSLDLDQEIRIGVENWVPPIIVILVISVAVGLKFFKGKLATFWQRLSDWFQQKLGDNGPMILMILTTFVSLAVLYGIIRLILLIMLKASGYQPY
ncbi:MAG: hypothetical protein ACPW60_04865 [Methylohalobius sp. ZOD2]|nr:hypothetical protein [Methylothermaceae bacterium]